jgi:importin subunit alpha-1
MFFSDVNSLSSIEDMLIPRTVDEALIRAFISYLDSDNTKLQLEACWVITNIAAESEENVKFLVSYRAIPKLRRIFFYSPHEEIRDQSAWALSNIAADSVQLVSHDELLPRLAAILDSLFQKHHLSSDQEADSEGKITFCQRVQIYCRFLCNLFRPYPHPPVAIRKQFLPYFLQIIHLFQMQQDIARDALWGTKYLTGNGDLVAEIVEKHGSVIPKIIQFLAPSYPPAIIIPALEVLGNILLGDEWQTQSVLNHQFLPMISTLLTTTENETILIACCWIISNITAGTIDQVYLVYVNHLIPVLIDLYFNEKIGKAIRKEVIWALGNTIFNVPGYVEILTKERISPQFWHSQESHSVYFMLKVIQSLSHFQGENAFQKCIEKLVRLEAFGQNIQSL